MKDAVFVNPGAVIGSIAVGSSETPYNTHSDCRLMRELGDDDLRELGGDDFMPWSWDASKVEPLLIREAQLLRTRISVIEDKS